MATSITQRTALVFVPFLLVTLQLVGCDMTDRQLPSYHKGYEPTQPIPFSHRLHAGEMGIECKYCHFGSEKGRHAGIPPVNVCMNCHKTVKTNSPEIKKIKKAYESGESIKWVRIHKLPDFVYFDHSRHINRGVNCKTCHGPVQEMDVVRQYNTLAMGWCINCHRDYTRNPPPHLKDKNINAKLDCAGCHY
jgi:hypothetical protein